MSLLRSFQSWAAGNYKHYAPNGALDRHMGDAKTDDNPPKLT